MRPWAFEVVTRACLAWWRRAFWRGGGGLGRGGENSNCLVKTGGSVAHAQQCGLLHARQFVFHARGVVGALEIAFGQEPTRLFVDYQHFADDHLTDISSAVAHWAIDHFAAHLNLAAVFEQFNLLASGDTKFLACSGEG